MGETSNQLFCLLAIIFVGKHLVSYTNILIQLAHPLPIVPTVQKVWKRSVNKFKNDFIYWMPHIILNPESMVNSVVENSSVIGNDSKGDMAGHRGKN